MQAVLSNPKRVQSQGEEIANSISRGIGVIAALVEKPFLLDNAIRHGDTGFIVGTSIFAASMILLYLASALYHAWPIGKAKRCFRFIEHSAIFILIAGTYTPLALGILRGALGWTLFGVVWGLAIAGVVLKAFYKTAHPNFNPPPPFAPHNFQTTWKGSYVTIGQIRPFYLPVHCCLIWR